MDETKRDDDPEGVGFIHDRDDAAEEAAREHGPRAASGDGVHPELGADAEAGPEAERSVGGPDPGEPSEVAPLGDGDDAGSPGRAGEVVKEILDDLPSDKSSQLRAILLALTQTSASNWSGMLPPPDEFYKFAPEDRERMMRWNDAGTVDESARQDRLVAAEIEQARRGPNRAMAVVVASIACAAISGWVFENAVLAALFLSPSLLMFAQSFISAGKSQASAKSDDSGTSK